MAEKRKTVKTQASVAGFLDSVTDPVRKADALALEALLTEVTGEAPQMWGPAIVGWGTTMVTYAGGRQEAWMKLGFSPRKAELAVYGLHGLGGPDADLTVLGKVTTGKGCVWVKRFSDLNQEGFRAAVQKAWRD